MRRGEIRWFRFQYPDKRRPVLVLGRNEVLPSLSQIVVVPLSTTSRGLRWEVPISSRDGLLADSVLKPEWIRSVERASIGPLVATLADERWPEVEVALLDCLGFTDPH